MRKFLIFLLLLLASPVWGARYFVTQSGTGTFGNNDSLTHQVSMAYFNTNATAGDVALLMNGTFTTWPNPSTNGNMAQPIIYMNVYGKRSQTTIQPGTVGLWTGSNHHFIIRDVTIRNSMELGVTTGTPTSRIGLRNVRVIDGTLRLNNAKDCRLDTVNVTLLTSSGDQLQLQPAGAIDSCQRDTIANSTFAAWNQVNTCNPASFLFTGDQLYLSALRCSTISNSSSATARRFVRISVLRNSHLINCSFWGFNNQPGGGIDEPMTFALKDGGDHNIFDTDSVVIVGTSNGSFPWINLSQNEKSYLSCWIGGNRYNNCYFSNQTGGFCGSYGLDGDTLTGNTFVGNGPIQLSYKGYPFAGTTHYCVVDHNVFASFGHYPALSMGNGAAEENVTFTNNIFYAPGLVNTDTSTNRVVSFGDYADWTPNSYGPLNNDYNLAWSPNLNTKRAVGWWEGYSASSAFGMAPWKNDRNPLVLDSHSIYGATIFRDSSLAHFDPYPLSGSAALDYGPQGYVGPLSGVALPDPIILYWIDPITAVPVNGPGGGIHRYPVPYDWAVMMGDLTATGHTQLQIDGVNIGDPVSLVGGIAHLIVPPLDAGPHEIKALYEGDKDFYGTSTGLTFPAFTPDPPCLCGR